MTKYVLIILLTAPAFALTYWQKCVGILDPTYNYMMKPTYPVSSLYYSSYPMVLPTRLLLLILRSDIVHYFIGFSFVLKSV